MTTVLKLLYGNDPLNPIRTQSLASNIPAGSGKIDLNDEGLVIGSGEINTIYTSPTLRREGGQRIASIPANQTIQLTYTIAGSTAPDIGYLQRSITRFALECKQKHEFSVGEKVWLQYRLDDENSSLAEPTFGVLSHFVEVLEIRIPRWPDSLHSNGIKAYRIGGIVAELVCKPYAQTPAQLAGHADGIIGSDSDINQYWDEDDINFLAGSLPQAFSICGWITHRESDYIAIDYYANVNSFFRIFWDESDSRFELVYNHGGGVATENGSVRSLSAGDQVFWRIRQNATNMYIDINDDAADATIVDDLYTTGGFLTAGRDFPDTVTANNTIDALKIWTEDIGATASVQIYVNELPIKTAGGVICPLPFCKTRSGNGTIEAVDGVVSASAKDNFAVVGGVPGDVEAEVRFEFDPPASGTTVRGYWLSRRAAQSVFTPLGSTFLDFSGTAASGSASGDAYESSGSTESHTFDASVNTISAIRGHPIYLARLKASAAANIYPYYLLGAEPRRGDNHYIEANDQMRLFNLGHPPKINWPDEIADTSLTAGLIMEAVSDSTLRNNLILSHNFIENGGVRYDSIGGHHLTEYGTVSRNTGPSGSDYAAEFSGSDYLWCPGNNNLSMSGDFSGSLFIYVDDLADANGWICGKYGGAGGREWVLLFSTASNLIQFTISNNGTNTQDVQTAAVSAATWYHIYFYHNSGTEIGIRINDTTTTTTAHTTGVFSGITEFTVGADALGANRFDGRVAHLNIYNRLLTSAEITEHYNSGDGINYPFAVSTVDLDFVNIFSEPYIAFEGDWSTLASGDTVVQQGTEAWVEDASNSDATLHWLKHVAGDPITVLPNHYNYITMLLGADGDLYDVTKSVTDFKAFITPRFRLPGA